MVKDYKLKKGDKAPDFETEDVMGNPIRLSDYKDKKLMLAFFRYAGCPWCNLAIFRLSQEYPKLVSKGLSLIAFVQSPKDTIVENITKRHVPPPPFPLVSDPEMKIYQLYGVRPSVGAAIKSVSKVPYWVESHFKYKFKQGKVDGNIFLVPAEFFIGPPDLTIYEAHYGSDYYDHTPFTKIYDFLIFGR